MDIISEFENGDIIACIDGNDKPLYTAAPDLLAALHGVDEACQQGLNSPEPVHWEASLQDIMDLVRAAITKAKGN